MSITGMIRRVNFLAVYYLYARHALRRTSTVLFNGLTLEIPPSVFHPKLYFSTEILAKYLSGLPLKGKAVLEMGCGSGALSLFVASRDALRVTSLDINPKAVECTRINAQYNGFGSRVEVFQSDLFATVPSGFRYDYIFWNPPFFPFTPGDMASHAWNAGENYHAIEKFAEHVGDFLKPEGTIILILSSDMDVPHIVELFTTRKFTAKSVDATKRLFEVFSIYEFRAR